MTRYRPDIPPHVAEVIRRLPPEVKRAVKNALRALCNDPLLGGALQRELEGLRKYRVRRYRIVYAIDRTAGHIRVVAVGHRRTVYERAAQLAQRRRGSAG